MLPKGVNKGSALIELCEMQGIPINRTYFIGDSYNDKEIFQTAGFSACVAETPLELQGLCNYVLGACIDGALADFIQILNNISLISA
jgi:hydroxymethylpyrimidine pyrophosphatase-like HAD family hydrolase